MYMKWGMVMIDTKAIGKRIQALRRAAGMTQEQAAETLGISPNYVSNIETGRDICSTVVLLGMANLYHASVDYMLGESLEYNRRKRSGRESDGAAPRGQTSARGGVWPSAAVYPVDAGGRD